MMLRVLVRRTACLGALGLLLLACGGVLAGTGSTGEAIGDLACPELRAGAANASFDANASANATIRAFVTASGDLLAVAAKAEASAEHACTNIARDLGADASELAERQGEKRVATVCRVAIARIDAVLAKGASARLEAKVTPPVCQARADVAANCKASCSGSFDPGYVRANCQPGQLYGRCDAQCTGSCSGTCNGECEGTCEGQGAGAASGAGAQGSASGRCAGRCQGTCKGSCSGDCKGGCSAEFQEPKCAVAMAPPKADARCEGSCKADAELQASCSPARADVRASVETGDMAKLVATLRANLPALVEVNLGYGARLNDDVQMLVRTGAELPSALGRVSSHAAACLGAAANACLNAQASLRVSVQASASISAKAGAGG